MYNWGKDLRTWSRFFAASPQSAVMFWHYFWGGKDFKNRSFEKTWKNVQRWPLTWFYLIYSICVLGRRGRQKEKNKHANQMNFSLCFKADHRSVPPECFWALTSIWSQIFARFSQASSSLSASLNIHEPHLRHDRTHWPLATMSQWGDGGSLDESGFCGVGMIQHGGCKTGCDGKRRSDCLRADWQQSPLYLQK